MSKSIININVTVEIANGIASFSYSPDGNIQVSKSTDIIFTLNGTYDPALSCLEPLIAYVPESSSRDITASLSTDKLSVILSDTDIDKEEIAVQLLVIDTYGNTYASPDPRIINTGPR